MENTGCVNTFAQSWIIIIFSGRFQLSIKNKCPVIYRSKLCNSIDEQNKRLIEIMNYASFLNYSYYLIMGDFNHPESIWEIQLALRKITALASLLNVSEITFFTSTSPSQRISAMQNKRTLN